MPTAAEELEPGITIAPEDLVWVDAPEELLPDETVTEDPTGRVVRSVIGRGEILVERHLGGSATDGPAAMLDFDQRGVAVPLSGVDLALGAGDRVDVLATLPPGGGAGDPTLVVARAVPVIAVDENTVTLAVDAGDATTITNAVITATVTLTLVR